jgi:AraC-like DNA-binding protein
MENIAFDEGKVRIDGKEQAIVVHYQEFITYGSSVVTHLHEYIEILYCMEGEFLVCLNGKHYDFSNGDMVVINSRESHAIQRKSKRGGYICIRFLPEILYTSSAAAFDIKYVMPFILNNSKHQRVFGKEEIQNTFIPDLVNDILRENQEKKYGYTLAMRANLTLIFLWIIRYWNEMNPEIANENITDIEMVERMQSVCEYVNDNYEDDIKASEMADMVNLSYSYFSRMFKQYMKKSFSEYLSYVRITHAEKKLVSTDKAITDIAMECGFSATSYFIKQFKRQKGISPKQYRKKLIN